MWLGIVIACLFIIFIIIALINAQKESEIRPYRTTGNTTASHHESNLQSSNLCKVSVELIDKVAPFGSKLRDKANQAWWEGKKYIYVTEAEFNTLNDAWHQYRDRELSLSKTASLNNRGMALERDNLIDDAINTYEECISLRYPASHAYERLMILYRKVGKYEDEQRVINIAIDVFTAENNRRAEHSKKHHPQYAVQIECAISSCEEVKNSSGMIIYCPYDVNKYRTRYGKSQLLMSKRDAKIKA